eukprot:scaffold22504_cov32-Tisochrysis_lutea.AAC.2
MSNPASRQPLGVFVAEAANFDAPVPVSSKMSANGARAIQPPTVRSAYIARGERRPSACNVRLARIEYMAYAALEMVPATRVYIEKSRSDLGASGVRQRELSSGGCRRSAPANVWLEGWGWGCGWVDGWGRVEVTEATWPSLARDVTHVEKRTTPLTTSSNDT